MSTKHDTYGLQFNVSQLLKEPTGATRHYEINIQPFGQLDEDVAVVAPLTGEIKFLRTGSEILVQGILQTIVEKNCGRCLEDFNAPVVFDLEEQFFPTIDVNTGVGVEAPDDADEANRIDAQHTLDLSEVVRQGLLLEIDSVLYCKPNCKGICLQCGQNLNLAQCDCVDDVIDARWASLLQKLETEDKP
ncbi:MAG: DUF177 domain-containing protein [Thermomicrobiales bacterium]|nr:DUF177 domain-containing protein [Thermomicrobiales bacterium]